VRQVNFRYVLLVSITAIAALLIACGADSAQDLATPGPSETAAAPEFPAGQTWFNVREPLTIAELRGKIVVLDFWTLGCINCQHIVPDLKRLESDFGDALVVIGVHSGKYDREHSDDSVRDAISRLGLEHPVVNDPDFVIWSAYGANAWPTTVVVDPEGNIVGGHSGEGVYDVVEPVVASLIEEYDRDGAIDRTPVAIDLEAPPIAASLLSFPGAVLADEAGGRLFIADSGHNRVLVADLDGALQSAIGSGSAGWSDGPAAEAQFDQPQGLALSPDGGTLYVADTRNHRIRAVDLASGEVRTLAGNGERLLSLPEPDAPGLATSLASPWGLAVVDGTLYVAMAGSHQIWTLDLATNAVSVFAGTAAEGIDDGPRLTATLAQPSGLAVLGEDLYWVDPESSSVRKAGLAPEGAVTTLVGTGLFDFGDIDGPPGVARLEHPQGLVAVDGVLYVADTYNHKLRTVDPATGLVGTAAGTGAEGGSDGAALAAAFAEPGALSAVGRRIYVADTNNHAVRMLDLDTANVSTLGFTNLAVAAAGIEGRTLKVSLPSQTVDSSASLLRITISAPQGYHLNELIDSVIAVSSSNADAVAPEGRDFAFATAERSIDLTEAIVTGEGQAIVSVTGEVYYCREDEEAICLIDRLDLALPVTVTDGGGREAVVDYELPQ